MVLFLLHCFWTCLWFVYTGQARTKVTLSNSVYNQVLNLYATIDPVFKQFLAIYRADIKRTRQLGSICEWKPPVNLPSKYTKYLTNTNVAFTIKRATFKGVDFNTEDYQRVHTFPFVLICSLEACFLFISLICLLYVSYMSLICLSYVSHMSLICLFYVSFMSLLCLFYVSFMSLLCLLYVSFICLLCLSRVCLLFI
jgi:hypothetical protein